MRKGSREQPWSYSSLPSCSQSRRLSARCRHNEGAAVRDETDRENVETSADYYCYL